MWMCWFVHSSQSDEEDCRECPVCITAGRSQTYSQRECSLTCCSCLRHTNVTTTKTFFLCDFVTVLSSTQNVFSIWTDSQVVGGTCVVHGTSSNNVFHFPSDSTSGNGIVWSYDSQDAWTAGGGHFEAFVHAVFKGKT